MIACITRQTVNVASVPQRSPFRYPGGKTWFVPYLRCWFKNMHQKPRTLIEPFAGGGIVGLTAAFEALVDHVILVELDENVASVWHTILSDDWSWLADRIVTFDMTADNLEQALGSTLGSTKEKAFRTILRNRTNRGGILASGSGRIKHGENGKGLLSRWYPETIARRIRDISTLKNKITYVHGNGMDVLLDHMDCLDAVFFIDPPYTAAGKKAGSRLYSYSELDHDALFRLAARLAGDFLMTYDNCEGVRAMAECHGLRYTAIPMKNTHNAEMAELLIGRSLHWIL